ncbi:cutinase family protein [Gordonia lacunae]|uniref:cutinase family protein n=1 Tax=Gordonia lacunae TaxID=417102 RepID=UPI0039E663E1
MAGTNDPESAHLVGVEERYTGKTPAVVDGDVVIVDDPGSPYLAEPKDVIHVGYPTTLWPLGAAGYDDSTGQGRSATASAIAGYQQRCGAESDIVVVGYSQGARVAGDVLADIGNGRTIEQVVATDENGEIMRDEQGYPVLVDIVAGAVSGELYADPRRATALAASLRSIVLLPVNFVRYWAGAIIGPVAPQTGTVAVLAADTATLRSFTLTRLATATDDRRRPLGAAAGDPGPGGRPTRGRCRCADRRGRRERYRGVRRETRPGARPRRGPGRHRSVGGRAVRRRVDRRSAGGGRAGGGRTRVLRHGPCGRLTEEGRPAWRQGGHGACE